jgi:ribosomal-protein-alanine N-acetyltransferase
MSIETKRLLLRSFNLLDTEKVYEMSQEKSMIAFLPDQVYKSLEQAKEVIEFLMSKYGHQSIVNHLPYVLGIELKEKNELIGHVGLSRIDKGIEIGYAIEEKYQGQNYATETVKAMTNLALSNPQVNEIWAVIDLNNMASIRVLEKSDYEHINKMRRIILISVLLMLSSIFIGCQSETNEEGDNNSLRIVSFDNGRVKYTLEENEKASSDHLVQIIGEGVENSEINEKIFLDGIPDLSGELLRVEIYGKIRNFEIIEVSFVEDSEGKMIENIIEKYDRIEVVENKVIILDTYFSDGIPSGKMQWENQNKKVFEYYFSQEGYGIDGEIIISE